MRMFKDDIFDALKLREYSKDLTEKEKKIYYFLCSKTLLSLLMKTLKPY